MWPFNVKNSNDWICECSIVSIGLHCILRFFLGSLMYIRFGGWIKPKKSGNLQHNLKSYSKKIFPQLLTVFGTPIRSHKISIYQKAEDQASLTLYLFCGGGKVESLVFLFFCFFFATVYKKYLVSILMPLSFKIWYSSSILMIIGFMKSYI